MRRIPNKSLLFEITDNEFIEMTKMIREVDLTQFDDCHVYVTENVFQEDITSETDDEEHIEVPLATKLQQQTLAYLFGLQFENQIENNVLLSNQCKSALEESIRKSKYIAAADKKALLKALENINTDTQILELSKQFQQRETKNRFDETVKTIVEQVCVVLNRKILNGQYVWHGITLPNMKGIEEDFKTFYESQQIQTFLILTPGGKALQKITNNAGIQLGTNLFLRYTRNKEEDAQRRKRLQLLEKNKQQYNKQDKQKIFKEGWD